jgi:preprotein translocase subunit SecF
MTKKIPLAIDAKPLAQAIDKSIKNTMTKKTMTKSPMTKALVYFAEGALVALAVVVAWGMLVMTFSL